ncbi:serine--tRNA ligase [bacterium]|nr:serine--tRNA ligase [bacterium]
MLDLKFILNNRDFVKKSCAAKHEPDYVDDIIDLAKLRKIYVSERDELRKKLNEVSAEIAKIARQKGDVALQRQMAKEISEQVKSVEEELRITEAKLNDLLLRTANIFHDSVPVGESEADNVIVRVEGEPKKFDFEPKNHIELNKKLKIIDFERGAKIAGSFFPMFVGEGARLVHSLIQFMLNQHTKDGKYIEVFPPFVANRRAMTGTAQIPKLEDDMYRIEEDDFFLIPTGEVPLVNYVAGETLSEDDLPIYLCAYTPCFRREAGSYGRDTKGLMRLHQFNKVELVKIVHPETSYDELEDLLADAEKILKILGLHYRIVELCTADLTFASAKTYDIELWAPGTKKWLEVSSVSNTTDFQARRMNTRFRSKADGKLHFVHTLNGSGTAIPRLLIALLETYQNGDGTVSVPEALQPFFGRDKIG